MEAVVIATSPLALPALAVENEIEDTEG